jgi:xanthine dehydrogenase accessory factor
LARIALGPSLGQCCGGAVTLVYERFDAYRVAGIAAPVWARRLEGAAAMPAAVAQARVTPWSAPRLLEGWLLEPVSPAAMPIWIWGAGHVGRALAAVLAPLDQFAVTWADFDAARFGGEVEGVQQISDANPVALLAQAPRDAQHLVLTHSHPLDLALCHAILGHGFASLGLIGSASKAARFAARLAALGHGLDEIARINCPIGEPELGKQPQAIAVGVAAALLRDAGKTPKRDA